MMSHEPHTNIPGNQKKNKVEIKETTIISTKECSMIPGTKVKVIIAA